MLDSAKRVTGLDFIIRDFNGELQLSSSTSMNSNYNPSVTEAVALRNAMIIYQGCRLLYYNIRERLPTSVEA